MAEWNPRWSKKADVSEVEDAFNAGGANSVGTRRFATPADIEADRELAARLTQEYQPPR
jgi:hypothetical protein